MQNQVGKKGGPKNKTERPVIDCKSPKDSTPEIIIRLRDITWGGRIRVMCQDLVWAIASEVAVDIDHGYYGGMASSSETLSLNFLDGSVSDTRGFFCDASCGMHWYGERVQAYILYRLGLDPAVLLKSKSIPTFSELEAELRRQHMRADINKLKNVKRSWAARLAHEKLSPQKAKKLLTEWLKFRLLRELQEKNEPPGGSKGT